MEGESPSSHSKSLGESLESSKEITSQPVVEEEEHEEEYDPLKVLTDRQIKYFKSVFDSLDTEKRGKIPAKHLAYVLRLIGLNPSKADMKKYYEELFIEPKGLVSFYFFLLPIARWINTEPETLNDILAAFESLDEDGKEYLTVDFLSEVLTSYGEDLDDFELELFFKVADPKNTGRVYYREFVERMFGVSKTTRKKKNKKTDKGRGKAKK